MEASNVKERQTVNDPVLCIIILQIVTAVVLILFMLGLKLSKSGVYEKSRAIYYKYAGDVTRIDEVTGENNNSELPEESEDIRESSEKEVPTSNADDTVSLSESENVFDFKVVQASLNTGISANNTMIWPLTEHRITSNFGEREDPFSGKNAIHNGLDMGANSGTPIMAVLDGTVYAVGEGKSYGKYIMIKHNDTMMTVYAHCSKIIAKNGQKVKKGEKIALVGNTGRSTGSHLHFEIRLDGERIDPLWLLP